MPIDEQAVRQAAQEYRKTRARPARLKEWPMDDPEVQAVPKPNETWRHFKGGRYSIVCTAEMEATGEFMVVYRGADGNHWVRPHAEWHDPMPPARQPRFVKVAD
jgi:hypothetical protein